MVNKFYKYFAAASFAALVVGHEAVAGPDDEVSSKQSAPISSLTEIFPKDVIKLIVKTCNDLGNPESVVALSLTSNGMRDVLKEEFYHGQFLSMKGYYEMMLEQINKIHEKQRWTYSSQQFTKEFFEEFKKDFTAQKSDNETWEDFYKQHNHYPDEVLELEKFRQKIPFGFMNFYTVFDWISGKTPYRGPTTDFTKPTIAMAITLDAAYYLTNSTVCLKLPTSVPKEKRLEALKKAVVPGKTYHDMITTIQSFSK